MQYRNGKRAKTLFLVWFLVCAAFVGMLNVLEEAKATTWIVDSGGGGNFVTIQDAINNSADGDTIYVWEGTYYENVVVNRTVTIIGNGTTNTTIDGQGSDVVTMTSDWANITEFTITNGAYGVGLVLVQHCRIYENNISSNWASGIFLSWSDNNNITGNEILDNFGGGILVDTSSSNDIINNNISYSDNNGIYFFNPCNDNTISGNNIRKNDGWGICFTGPTNNNEIYRNNIIGNNPGNVQVYDDGNNYWNATYPDGGNYWSDYTGTDGNGDGMGDTPYTNIAGFPGAQDNYPLVHPYGSIVNTNTSEIFLSIQSAVDNASVDNTILVLSDTYYENVVIDKTINLIGEDLNTTVIDGGGSGDVVNITANGVLLAGFTITNSGGGTDAGIKLYIVQNCYITQNTIIDNNYGIRLELSNNNLIYHNNILRNTNQAYDAGINSWFFPSPFGGNYWSDWVTPDDDRDGFVDYTYFIPGGEQDDLPLTRLYGWWLSTTPVHNLNTGEDFTTIQTAIDAVSTIDGHTIYADNGTYYENVIVNKTLTLMGEDRASTIIDSLGFGDVVYIESNWVNLTGFTITNSGAYGVQLSNVFNCHVYDNDIYSPVNFGVYVNSGSYNNISGNTILGNGGIDVRGGWTGVYNNNIDSMGFLGIRVWMMPDTVIVGNNITNASRGVFDFQGPNANTMISNNDISGCGGGIYFQAGGANAYATVSDNNIFNNNWGIYCEASHGNQFTDNAIISNAEYGLYLTGSNNNEIINNIFSNNGVTGIFVRGFDNTVNGNNVSSNTGIAPPPWGLAGYWKLNEGADQYAYDVSGNGNDGILGSDTGGTNDPAWVDGQFEGGLEFDGVATWVEILTDDSLNITTEITLEAWIKIYGNTGDHQTIASKWFDDGAPATAYVLETDITGQGLRINLGGVGWWESSTKFNYNEWVHGAVTYDGSAVKFYLNGVETDTFPIGGTISSTAAPLFIGAHDSSGDRNPFNGIIDELRIFDRALSDEEIFNQYMGGIHLKDSGGNVVYENDIFDNSFVGLSIANSENNQIYHNNFLSNRWEKQALDFSAGTNLWDLGLPWGGNFWDDWTAPDNSPIDGFVDNPYVLEGNVSAQDNWPFARKSGWLRVQNLDTGLWYFNIQDAIDNASEGHTLYAHSGRYYENVVVDKPLTIIGGDRETTIIDGGGSGDVVHVSAEWVNITGFKVTNSGAVGNDAGIELDGVDHCHIYNNNVSTNNRQGIYLSWDSNSNTISGNDVTDNVVAIWLSFSSDNTISYNKVSDSNYGIYLDGGSNRNTISYNNIHNNGDGIWLDSSYWNTFSDNEITSNSGSGIYIESSSNNNITDSNITNNNIGINLVLCSFHTTSGNNISQNSFIGILFESSDSNPISGNDISDNGFGMVFRSSSFIDILDNNFTSNDWHGIKFETQSNYNTISGNDVSSNSDYGIYLDSSEHNTISDNDIFSNTNDGIWLNFCNYSTISNNNISGNNNGVYISGGINNTISNNNITSNNNDGIYLEYASGNTISGNNLSSNTNYEIHLEYSSNNTISGNNISLNPGIGIFIYSSSNNNLIAGNNISECGYGIAIAESNSNTISANIVTSSYDYGIYTGNSKNNIVNNNNLSNNKYGIYLETGSNYNIIYENNIITNSWGIVVYDIDNQIYHNNIIDNTIQAISVPSSWNLSYPGGGNYWSDYTGSDYLSGINQDIPGSDGFGDTPYEITGGAGAKDYYPFTRPTDAPSVGDIIIISHSDDEYVSGTILIEAAVTFADILGVNFYVNGTLMFTDNSYPYQFVLDTTSLTEDEGFTLTAEATLFYGFPIHTSITLIVNNYVDTGNYITVVTLELEYQPDEDVSVMVALMSPPAFESLVLGVNCLDPNGDPLYTSNLTFPYGSEFRVILSLPSDAALGAYTVTVDAYGYVDDSMVWSATNITTFLVSGESLREELEGLNDTLSRINDTINDIQNRVMDIQTALDSMNLTLEELQDAVEYLNQTLPIQFDNLSAQLLDVNDSLMNRIVELENTILGNLTEFNNTNIMDYLQGMNASLYSEIQNLLTSITSGIIGMNDSLSKQLTDLLNNMTTDNDALRDWLEIVLGQIDANLTDTKNTLQQQLDDLNTTIQTFHNEIQADLIGVHDSLSQMENNLSLQHTAITDAIDTLNDTIAGAPGLSTGDIMDRINDSIAILQDLDTNMTLHDIAIQGLLGDLDTLVQNQGNMTRDQLLANVTEILDQMQNLDADIVTHDDDVKENLTVLQNLIDNIGTMDLSEIMNALAEMEGNLSALDTTLASDIGDVKDSVEAFQQDMEGRLAAINSTLDELEKLQYILDDLSELDQALTESKDELKAEIDEIPAEKKEEEGFGMAEILLILVLALLVINLLLMLMGGKAKKVGGPEAIPEERIEEAKAWEEPKEETGQIIQEAEAEKEPIEELYEELECTECGAMLGPGQTVCPNCGEEFELEEVEE